ncbi:MAG: hypothetical protein ACXWDO_01025, partial [Bacteroidia bacterium]
MRNLSYLIETDLDHIRNENKNVIPDSVFSQMLISAKTDTIPYKWNCSKLTNVKCLGTNAIDTMIYVNLFEFTTQKPKKYWSKRKLERKEKEQIKIHNAESENRPKQERTVYYFTKPIYSSDNQYAIMSFRDACGWLCGSSVVFLFKNEN